MYSLEYTLHNILTSIPTSSLFIKANLSPKALTATSLLNSPPVSIIQVCFCQAFSDLLIPDSTSNFFTKNTKVEGHDPNEVMPDEQQNDDLPF